jgi:hypothetical protein
MVLAFLAASAALWYRRERLSPYPDDTLKRLLQKEYRSQMLLARCGVGGEVD